jgi:ubiquinone/menaquinone biosynthesis C-methylase UbiE
MPRISHPVFARLYPRLCQAMDWGGIASQRSRLLAGLAGEVIEIGCGDGKNFPRYPLAVAHVHAVEPEPHLRRLARGAAAKAPVPIEVTDGRGERLPATDASMDAAVVTFALCTIQDPVAALREAYRVLKPGGQLRYLEHVRADSCGLARVQDLLDATIWPVLAGGCHVGRDSATAIEEAGFTIERLDRFLFPEVRTPVSFFISGTARRL